MELNELHTALASAQGEMSAPHKNKEVTVKMKSGGSYKFKYATLDGIIENTLRPTLPKHGLWFAQRVENGQMVTRITHASGQYMDCGIPCPNLPNAPQEAGSLLTYFKRYSLCAAFGIMADEDDDANIAQGNDYDKSSSQPQKQEMTKSITDAQSALLVTLCSTSGTDVKKILKAYNIGALPELPASAFDNVKSRLETTLAEKPKTKQPEMENT